MAIAFRDSVNAQGSAVTSLALAVPPLVQAGDTMLMFAGVIVGRTINTPTGWTALTGSPVSDVGQVGYAWRKTAVAADLGSTVTLDIVGGSEKMCGAVAVWSGVDTAAPIHQINSAVEAGTTLTHVAPSVTTTVAGATLVYVLEMRDAATGATVNVTVPSGSGKRVQSKSGGTEQQLLVVAGQNDQPVGTYGGGTFVSDAAGSGQLDAVLWTVALTPAVTQGQQTIYPTSDVTTTNWSAVPALAAAETFSSRVGEAARDDTSYVQSSINATSLVFASDMQTLIDPGAGSRTGYRLDYVLSTAGGATSSTVVVAVVQGATTVATWTETSVPATPTPYQRTLTDAEIATINYSLPLRFKVTATVA